LKWAGGKRRLIPQLLVLLPPNVNRYYEPFVGGGALFFSITPNRATLSDTNEDLINAYVQIRDNPDALISSLKLMENSAKAYYKIRESAPATAVGRAARLIYLCNLSFNGIYRQNLNGRFNVPYGFRSHLDPCNTTRIREIHTQLKGRTLLARDFEVATKQARRGDLVYFDPPYTVAHGNNGFVKYNAKIFSWADQQRLAIVATRLKSIGCNVLVSNADHPSVHELYKNFNVHIVTRQSSMAAATCFRGPVRECIFY